ncbi:MAG: HNH endonuclease [Acidaminobacteraceae bacterium]
MNKCVYCGSKDNLTKEHIPPKSIFSKPRPSNLITVPACKSCNNGLSEMDEYFRFFLTIEYMSGSTTYANENSDKVMRGLNRPEKSTFVKQLSNIMVPCIIKNPLTGVVEESSYFCPDSELMNSRVRDIVKGLFFHHTGKYCYERFLIIPHWLNYQLNDKWKEYFKHLDNVNWNYIGGSVFIPVFSYKYYIVDGGNYSWWLLEFFKHQRFSVIMRRKFDVEI